MIPRSLSKTAHKGTKINRTINPGEIKIVWRVGNNFLKNLLSILSEILGGFSSIDKKEKKSHWKRENRKRSWKLRNATVKQKRCK